MAKVKILLVDDHPENLVALEAILDSPLYDLVRAQSGNEALKHLLKDDRFALILMDVLMPDLDGFETAALIKKHPKLEHIPIIFLTAVNKEEPFIFKGYSVGAVDYLFKPFEPVVLKSKVAVFVELFSSREQIRWQAELLRQSERRENARRLSEQRRASQERYRNLAEAIPQIVWTAKPDGTIDYCNQRWFDYTGLSLEQTVGWGWETMIHPEDAPPMAARWQQAVLDERDYEGECRLRRSDGSYRWHLVRALPERDREGKVIAWLGTSTDIDDRKRSEEVLKQKTIEAEEATRLKSEFVSNVSHELRTPLNAILGYSTLLLEETYGPIAEDQKEPLEGIQRNGSELLHLINNLLDLSRIESGRMPVSLSAVDLRPLLPEVFENVKSLMKGKEIEIAWRIQDNLKVIQSDPLKVRQIFLNLLSNAIKFTEKGSIVVSACNVKNGIQFSVGDTGLGMREEDLPHIFDPFRQIDGSMTRKVGGSGLGLTIVKNALGLLHGTIDVQSEFGRGSTFTIFLPDRFSHSPETVERSVSSQERILPAEAGIQGESRPIDTRLRRNDP